MNNYQGRREGDAASEEYGNQSSSMPHEISLYTLRDDFQENEMKEEPVYQSHTKPVSKPVDHLIPVSHLRNKKYESTFTFKHFNRVQSKCFDSLFHADRNIVVSAPTGSGKTCLLELAILRLVHKSPKLKAIYIAPTKALVEERQRDWAMRFKSIGVTVAALTGDTDKADLASAQGARVIVTTAEKWDSMTRQRTDSQVKVGLLCIDEIHTLKDGVRGATLEAVVTRMKVGVRVIALSATIPNADDFAAWLKDQSGKALVFVFGEDYRPVKLKTVVVGVPLTGNAFQFEESLKYRLMDIIGQYSTSKPCLIFCSTRKATVSSAEYLASDSNGTFVSERARLVLPHAAQQISDRKLAACVSSGIGYHHGGLAYQDRRTIEGLFLDGYLRVICTTSTLAVGVNLPAHLVIIKGTTIYDTFVSKTIDYSDLDVLQMMGRAGRPQFDEEGTAVILTSLERKWHFENMGRELIESSLHESLIEHLNSEIALSSIGSKEGAMEWLKSTFLYVRIQKNAGYYRLKNCTNEEANLGAEKRLEAIFMKDIQLLKDTSLVVVGERISSTEFGQIMSRNYMRFHTVEKYIQLSSDGLTRNLLEVMCQAEEFNSIRFHSDKTILGLLNKHHLIRYPIKGKISHVHQKVNLLIQAVISNINLNELNDTRKNSYHTLAADSNLIMRNAHRLARGMLAIFLAKRELQPLLSCLIVCQSVCSRVWPKSAPFQQLEGVGLAGSKLLVQAGIDSFASLKKCDSQRIELLFGRNPPFGSKLLHNLEKFPVLQMSINQLFIESKVDLMEFQVDIVIQSKVKQNVYFIAGTSSGLLIEIRKILRDQSFKINFALKNKNDKVICSLVLSEISGLDVQEIVSPIKNDYSFSSLDDDSLWAKVDLSAIPCKHKCDKSKCSHQCCKEGLKQTQKGKEGSNQTLKGKEGSKQTQKGKEGLKQPLKGKKRLSESVDKGKKRKITVIDQFLSSELSWSEMIDESTNVSFVTLNSIEKDHSILNSIEKDHSILNSLSNMENKKGLPSEYTRPIQPDSSFLVSSSPPVPMISLLTDLESKPKVAYVPYLELEKVLKPKGAFVPYFEEEADEEDECSMIDVAVDLRGKKAEGDVSMVMKKAEQAKCIFDDLF